MQLRSLLTVATAVGWLAVALNGQVVHSISTTVADLEVANLTERFANSYLRYKMPEMAQGMDDTCHQIVRSPFLHRLGSSHGMDTDALV